MVELVISALMWALVLVLIVFRRARKERSVLYAAVTIAIAMMLNDDDLYFVVDSWFGHRDIVHLISAIMLMVGVYFLTKGISRARVRRYMKGWAGRITLWVAIAITTVSFALIPHQGETTESFMRVYGEYPAATVYSSTQYIYLFAVFGALAMFAVNTIRESTIPREKAAGIALLVGSLATVALSIVTIGMNVANLVGGLSAAEPWRPWYYGFQVATFAFLTLGLGIAPISRWVRQSRYERGVERYIDKLTPLWEDAIDARPSPKFDAVTTDAEHRLHRRIVEIRDAAMDRRNNFDLGDEDRRLLAEAEQQLLAGTR
jgi:hypothetical protein